MRNDTNLARYDFLYFRMLRRIARRRELDKKGPGKVAMTYAKRKPRFAPNSEAARVHALGLD